jgi:hypothetical protein
LPSEVHAYCAAVFGIAVSAADVGARELVAYGCHAALLRPRAEAMELFEELRALGAVQGIVSNSERIIVDVNLRAVRWGSWSRTS